MAKITNFTFCEEFGAGDEKEIIPVQKVLVNGDFFSLNILITMFHTRNISDEMDGCVFRIKNPQEKISVETPPVEFDASNNGKDAAPDTESIVGMTMKITLDNIPFDGEGVYCLEFEFNKEVIGTFYILVYEKD